jgi:two-component system, NtrC family, response regulator HydG
LYYRLRVVEVPIPPLRERREDVPLLVDRFLRDAAERLQRAVKPLTGEALRTCVAHEWKGNVRELKSAIEQALLLAPGPEITPADLLGEAVASSAVRTDGGAISTAAGTLPPESGAPPIAGGARDDDLPADSSFRAAKERIVVAFERDFLLQALRRHDGNITKAAEEIGMYRQNFQQKMRELGITVEGTAAKPVPDSK